MLSVRPRSSGEEPRSPRLSPRVAWTLAALAALGTGGAVALRVVPMEPWLDLHVSPVVTTDRRQFVEIRATPRGGGGVDAIGAAVVSGEALLTGTAEFRELPRGNAAIFKLNLPRDQPGDPVVRVRQRGTVERTYDVRVAVDRP